MIAWKTLSHLLNMLGVLITIISAHYLISLFWVDLQILVDTSFKGPEVLLMVLRPILIYSLIGVLLYISIVFSAAPFLVSWAVRHLKCQPEQDILKWEHEHREKCTRDLLAFLLNKTRFSLKATDTEMTINQKLDRISTQRLTTFLEEGNGESKAVSSGSTSKERLEEALSAVIPRVILPFRLISIFTLGWAILSVYTLSLAPMKSLLASFYEAFPFLKEYPVVLGLAGPLAFSIALFLTAQGLSRIYRNEVAQRETMRRQVEKTYPDLISAVGDALTELKPMTSVSDQASQAANLVRAWIAMALVDLNGAGRGRLLQMLYERGFLFEGTICLANLSFQNAGLAGSDLSRSNLRGVNLRGANLENSNLSGCNLSHTNLMTTRAQGANLTEANLTGADLRSALLFQADLRGATIKKTDFRGANLSQIKTDQNLDGTSPTPLSTTRSGSGS